MSARARSVPVATIAVVGFAVVLVVILLWTNMPRGTYRLMQIESRRTWVVDAGEPRVILLHGSPPVITLSDPVTFPQDEIRVHDRFMCERGIHSVHAPLLEAWVDEGGRSDGKFFWDIGVTRNQDGSVTVTCYAPMVDARPTYDGPVEF